MISTSVHNDLKEFTRFVRRLGKDVRIVQGGGGNFSIKDSDRTMFVKPSGVRFTNIQPNDLVAIDLVKFQSGFRDENKHSRSLEEHERAMNELLTMCRIGTGQPSMETAMHSFLPTFALHCHAVPGNVVLCAQESEEVLRDVFPNTRYAWIPYVSPGFALGAEIMDAPPSELYFLQNHGVIVCGEFLARVQELLEDVLQGCTKFLHKRISRYQPFHFKPRTAHVPNHGVPSNFLFPDAAIYINRPTSTAAEEVFAVQNYLEQTMIRAGLTPKFLSAADVRYIQNMEAEQYRQRQV